MFSLTQRLPFTIYSFSLSLSLFPDSHIYIYPRYSSIDFRMKIILLNLGSNTGLASVSGNSSVYGTLGNSVSSTSSVYQSPNGVQSIYHSNGANQQGQYPHSNYSNALQTSAGNLYGTTYPSSSSQLIPPNDLQTSSSSWNQYAAATNLANGANQTAYDPNMYYAPYSNIFAQQYYLQQQQVGNQSQSQVPLEQTYSPNGYPTTSNGGLDKTYQQHHAR